MRLRLRLSQQRVYTISIKVKTRIAFIIFVARKSLQLDVSSSSRTQQAKFSKGYFQFIFLIFSPFYILTTYREAQKRTQQKTSERETQTRTQT